MRFKCRNKAQSGFTLLEVLIALVILSIIGVLTARAISEALRLREQLLVETEVNVELRAGYFILERDLSQVFNPISMLPTGFARLDPNAPPPPPVQSSGDSAQPGDLTARDVDQFLGGNAFVTTEFWGPVIHSSGVRASRFKGNEREFSFISNSNIRIYKERRESIFLKVRYSVVPSKTPGEYELVKTTDTAAFDLEDKKESPSSRSVPILTHLKSMDIQYTAMNQKDAYKTWDSETQQNTIGQFPESVRFVFQIVDRSERVIDQEWLFRLEAMSETLPGTY
jgi:prepilin-type N-terminal cleavage/methylation domain-containing protein